MRKGSAWGSSQKTAGTWRRAALFLALLPLLVAHATNSQGQEKPKTLRVVTRLVNVNVVVLDAQGHSVKGLGKEDFAISDEGRPQQVDFFSSVENAQAASHAAADPDTYTNNLEASGATPSVTILLFDALNSWWTSQGYALHRIRKFLRQIEREDHIGVYVLSDGLHVVHPFTRDSSELVAAIHRYDEKHSHRSPEAEEEGEGSTGDPTLDRFLTGKDLGRRFSVHANGPPLTVTTRALEAICRQLAKAPGRKTLIWVTDSIAGVGQFLGRNLSEMERLWRELPENQKGPSTEQLIRMMNDANICVYLVDSEGLGMTFGRWPIQGAMRELTSRTGGRAFINRNDLETGIRRAVEDSRYTYSMAFAPDHNLWNGEWRKLEVKVNQPGARVLSRAGYFALPEATPLPEKRRLNLFREIAASPVDATALPLSVHLAAVRTGDGTRLDARIRMDVLPMLTLREDGHWSGTFELMLIQAAGDQIVGATPRGVHADLKPAQYATIAEKGWDLPMQLKLLAGARELCVILHDENTDAVGSVHIPLARYNQGAPAQ